MTKGPGNFCTFHQESQYTKNKHDPDVEHCVIQRIGTNQAKNHHYRQNKTTWQIHQTGNIFNRAGHQYPHQDVRNQTGCNHTPDNIRVSEKQSWSRLDGMNHQPRSGLHQSHFRGSPSQSGNQCSTHRRIICRFGSNDSFLGSGSNCSGFWTYFWLRCRRSRNQSRHRSGKDSDPGTNQGRPDQVHPLLEKIPDTHEHPFTAHRNPFGIFPMSSASLMICSLRKLRSIQEVISGRHSTCTNRRSISHPRRWVNPRHGDEHPKESRNQPFCQGSLTDRGIRTIAIMIRVKYSKGPKRVAIMDNGFVIVAKVIQEISPPQKKQ